MLTIRLTGVAALTRQLDDLARRQIPYAKAQAINATAKAAARDANAAMPSVFKHANAFTRTAIGTPVLATKANPMAIVAVKPIQLRYLQFEIAGGTRTPADNTRSQSRALVLPGKGTTPLARGAVKRIAQQAQRQAAQQGARKARKGAGEGGVFKASGQAPWGGAGGFFRRLPGHHLTRLISFEAQAQYQPKYHFREQVLASVAGNWPREFEEALARALRTAK